MRESVGGGVRESVGGISARLVQLSLLILSGPPDTRP